VVLGADHVMGGKTGQFLAGLVPEHDLVPGIEHECRHRGVLHQVLGKGLLVLQERFHLLSLRDVPHHVDQADHLVVAVEPGDGPRLDIHVQVRLERLRGGRLGQGDAAAARTVRGRAVRTVKMPEAFYRTRAVCRQSKPLLRRAVCTDDRKVFVMDGDHVGDRVEGIFPVVG